MTNYVNHRAIITGSVANVAAFKARAIGANGELHFTAYVRMIDYWTIALVVAGHEPPETVLSNPWASKEGIRSRDDLIGWLGRAREEEVKRPVDAQDWRWANWGTLYGQSIHLQIESDEPERLELTFLTAVSTPVPVFEAMAREHPTLRFDVSCHEEGFWFDGHGFFNGGAGDPQFVLRRPAAPPVFDDI